MERLRPEKKCIKIVKLRKMAYEINIGKRTAHIDLLNRAGSKMLIAVDDNRYEIDLVMVENGVYSILYNGQSYNVELIEGSNSKQYIVNTHARSFNAEIVDAEAKYQQSRIAGHDHESRGACDLRANPDRG
jgi:hypothetical protein